MRNKKKDILAGQLSRTCESFVEQAEWLARDLNKRAERVREEGADATLNTLGEVQGRGSSIDILCAKIGTLREVLELEEVGR